MGALVKHAKFTSVMLPMQFVLQVPTQKKQDTESKYAALTALYTVRRM